MSKALPLPNAPHMNPEWFIYRTTPVNYQVAANLVLLRKCNSARCGKMVKLSDMAYILSTPSANYVYHDACAGQIKTQYIANGG